MPKRVIDFDALWASDKLASCAEWAQAEYAWLYGLADASGSFEMTNLRVIWGRVAAVRKSLTLERLEQIFEEFAARGLLFTWRENGKRYGHWTGSDVPGRLPPPSWRARLERLAPPVPRDALLAYTAQFRRDGSTDLAGVSELAVAQAPAMQRRPEARPTADAAENAEACRALKPGLEAAQGQDWEGDLERKREKTPVCPQLPVCDASIGDEVPDNAASLSGLPIEAVAGKRSIGERGASSGFDRGEESERAPRGRAPKSEPVGDAGGRLQPLLAIYEAERGTLPPAGRWSAERRRRARRRLAAGLTLEDFRAAVRRAAATPFLAGGGERGWCASFDWLIANDANVRKVLEGHYEPAKAGPAGSAGGAASSPERRAGRTLPELRAGAGPVAEAFGVRIKPGALERLLARKADPDSGSGAVKKRGGPLPMSWRAERRESPQADREVVAHNAQERAS